MPMISFLSSLAVLPTCYLLHDSRLLGLTLRPSAPVCCCHPVSWARGRLAFAQEAVRVSPSLSSRFSCSCWSLQGLSGSREKCLFMRCGNVMALQIREMVFGVSHIPGACTVLDHFFWVRLAALKNHDVLLRCGWVHCLSTTNRRTSSRLVRCVTFAWAPMRFNLRPFASVEAPIVPWQVGYANGSHFGYRWMIPSKKANVEDWVFQVTDPSDISLPGSQGIFFLRLQRCRCLFPRHKGKHRNPRFHLVLRNTLRHHCLLCSHDLHVNVWSYLSPLMLYCQATRIFTCPVLISLQCGVKWQLMRFWPST